MRPAGKGPLDSLYFHYPIFPVGHAPGAGAIASGTRSSSSAPARSA